MQCRVFATPSGAADHGCYLLGYLSWLKNDSRFFAPFCQKQKGENMKTRQGFTLIELLVVVLIIGILSSVALPQYTKAVEKARATEAVQTAATLTRAIDIWLMENGGFPASTVEDLGLSIEIDGGEWHEGNFYTTTACYTNSCDIEIWRSPEQYTFALQKTTLNGEWNKICYTQLTEIGRNICKSMTSHGYTYSDTQY